MNQYLIVSKENECYQEIFSELLIDDPNCQVRRVRSIQELQKYMAGHDAEYAVIKLEIRECGAEKKNGTYGDMRRKNEMPAERVAEEGAALCPSQKDISDKEKCVEWLKRYVSAHIGDNLNLDSLSSCLYISKNYMSTLFSQQAGISLKNYIIHQRMEKARRLLLHSRLPIRDIAALVGYASPSHFSQVFQRIYHEKPSDYRKFRAGGRAVSSMKQKETAYPPAARQLTAP